MYNDLNYMIKYVTPKHFAEEVSLNHDITVMFAKPLDASTVNDANFWVIKEGNVNRIPGAVSYVQEDNMFYIVFTPSVNYEANTTYQITVRGESELVQTTDEVDEGIRDAFGYGIAGDYTWTFTTGSYSNLDKVILLNPSDKISTLTTPIFSWEVLTGANEYEIVVSENPSFESSVWITTTILTQIAPPMAFDDKEYWWKIRAIDADNNEGEWSNIWSFYKGDIDVGIVAEEDMPFVSYPLTQINLQDQSNIALLNTFPSNELLNVSLNFNYVVIEISGYVNPDKINESTFKVIGEAITKDSTIIEGQTWWSNSFIESPVSYSPVTTTADVIRAIESHGLVSMNRMVLYDPDTDKTILLGIFNIKDTITNTQPLLPMGKSTSTVRITPAGNINGVNTEFVLPNEPIEDTIRIFIDGELQVGYTLIGSDISFTTAPTFGSSIEAIYEIGYSIRETLIGDYNGSNTVFRTSKAPIQSTLEIVKNDMQDLVLGTDYTIVNNIITLLEAPVETDILYVLYQAEMQFIINQIPVGNINGINTIFILNSIPIYNSEQISVNGLLKYRGVDYTILDNIITFTTAPTVGDILLATFLLEETHIINDIPLGTMDGVNTIFSLSSTPSSSTLQIFYNGRLLDEDRYTLSMNSIELDFAPVFGDILQANYQTKDKFKIPYPTPTSVNYLVPNNKYTMILNLDDLYNTNWFTSQYWPLFAELSEVKVELSNLVDMNDSTLYYLIRQKSIDAIFIKTSPFHYLIKSDDPIGALRDIPFDPNNPVYCVYQYVKYKTAYDVLSQALVAGGLLSGGEKQLGELEIVKSSINSAVIGGPNKGGVLGILYDKLKLWEDCIYGHTGVGRAHIRSTVRGENNRDQYQNDYPLNVRMAHSTNHIINNPKWSNTL